MSIEHIRSSIKMSCPSCHKGFMFKEPNPYKLSETAFIKEKCEYCNQVFEPETGFYYGAMYVSYGITVGFSIALFALYFLFYNHLMVWPFIVADAVVIILFYPIILRVSRSIWLHLFVKSKVND